MPKLLKLWWLCKAYYWLWCWKRWLKYIHQLPTQQALVQITRLRWKVCQNSYEPRFESAFLEALKLTEESVRQKATPPLCPPV